MNDLPIPCQALAAFNRQFEGIWSAVDRQLAHRVALHRRLGISPPPAHVLCSFGEGTFALAAAQPRLMDIAKESAVRIFGGATAGLFAWRATQGIYRFDPALYQTLLDGGFDTSRPLPPAIVRIPEWCVYLETPRLPVPNMAGTGEFYVDGVWAWFDTHTDGVDVLCIMLGDFLFGTPQITTLRLDQTFDQTKKHIIDAWKKSLAGPKPPVGEENVFVHAALFAVVPLLLYLCSDNADMIQPRQCLPTPLRTKRGLRYFPPNQPRTWDVGTRIGAALRRGMAAAQEGTIATATGTHASPRPHIRRAHWHTYLVGQGRLDRRLKWIPPIPINVEDLDQLPATIRPVG
ncbi:MAG: hypothetical protein WC326_01910 [Candidatus Delongbacteria bacterium]